MHEHNDKEEDTDTDIALTLLDILFSASDALEVGCLSFFLSHESHDRRHDDNGAFRRECVIKSIHAKLWSECLASPVIIMIAQ